ncbi:SPX domain-containing membrane protein [Musa troglodytarum]|uniref:SPX domain-containing membrane protein n=1 Tax=Musa troglodytarum TaxID=320322 RepID=A0A9E7K5H2_9LILI|nr:SPX domain-containing membrane protein [Musa troglodytarum]
MNRTNSSVSTTSNYTVKLEASYAKRHMDHLHQQTVFQQVPNECSTRGPNLPVDMIQTSPVLCIILNLASASENVRAQNVPLPHRPHLRQDSRPRPSTATRVYSVFVYLLLPPAFPSAPGSADEPYKWRGIERHAKLTTPPPSRSSSPFKSLRAECSLFRVYESFVFLFLADGHLINPFCCAPNHQDPISPQVHNFDIKMVNFGKKLMADQVQEWRGYYINYKLMKKKLKQYVKHNQAGGELRQVLKEFSRMLDEEIEKIVLFLLEQQGLLASRIQELAKKRDILLEQPDISQLHELQEAYRAGGYDLIKLLKFVDMNATGLRKILKKFDKRFGYKFTDYYVTSRANHPYSQLQQVFKHVGIGAVVGALSRNLADLNVRQGSYLSIYDQPSIVIKDPVIDQINSSVDKLTHSTNFLQFLGQHALIVQEDITSAAEDHVDEQKYHFMSLLLNLANTFLYMVNTYIIVPTADDYALSLGAAATVCGVIIGSMAVAQVFSSVYFSAWSNKSYFRPLIFSSIMLLMGNTLYALAYDLNSIAILLIGRLLCGLGSARAVNRRYISDCVPLRTRMKASAGFVSASALGMACGPAIAGLLQTNFKIYGLTFNQTTLPGWLMTLAWLIYLFWLWISFREPAHDSQESHVSQDAHSGHPDSENGLAQPLLISQNEKQDEHEDQDCDDREEASDESQSPATSIASAYRLLTPSVKVQLMIYFMLKYAMEILLSESSVVTTIYFNWSTSNVAIFLAILGLTVLPVNAVIGSYITNMFEDRQILLASEIIVLVGIIFSFRVTSSYSVPQYVSSAFITFVSAEVLEGVNLSLLSRVMSTRLARGTFNGGLLSTEAGTLARVVADGTITLAGYFGEDNILNITLLPSLLICLASISATFFTYNTLY